MVEPLSAEHIKQMIGPPLWEHFVNCYWHPRHGFVKGVDIYDESPHQTREAAEEEARQIDDFTMQYQYTIRISKQEGGRPVSEVIVFDMPDKTDHASERADIAVNEARRGE